MLDKHVLTTIGHGLQQHFEYVLDLSYTKKINQLLDKLEDIPFSHSRLNHSSLGSTSES